MDENTTKQCFIDVYYFVNSKQSNRRFSPNTAVSYQGCYDTCSHRSHSIKYLLLSVSYTTPVSRNVAGMYFQIYIVAIKRHKDVVLVKEGLSVSDSSDHIASHI